MCSSISNLNSIINYRQGIAEFKEKITKPKVTIGLALLGTVGFVVTLNLLLNWTSTTHSNSNYHCFKGPFIECDDTNQLIHGILIATNISYFSIATFGIYFSFKNCNKYLNNNKNQAKNDSQKYIKIADNGLNAPLVTILVMQPSKGTTVA